MSNPVPPNAVYARSLGILANTAQDQTDAINVALASLRPGQALVLDAGSYTISAALVMPSGSELYGPSATIKAAATWRGTLDADPAKAAGYAMLVNTHFAASKVTDTGLTVDGIAFDYGARTDGGTHAIRFRQASGVKILNCSFNGGDDGTALLACDTTLVQGCTATNTRNAAFDHWEGTSNATVTGCTARVTSGSGILFTGAGTNAGDHHTARNVVATGNVVTGAFGALDAGILADALSANSAVQGVTFTGNTVSGGNATGSGIGVDGRVSSVSIANNTVTNVAGFAVFALPDDSGAAPSQVQMTANTLRGNVNPWAEPAAPVTGPPAQQAGLVGLSGAASVLTTDGACEIMAGDGAATITAGGSDVQGVTVYGGRGALNFINGINPAYVYGGEGPVTVSGGVGGGLFVGGHGGHNLLRAGRNATTIVGGGGGDVLQAAGAAGDVILASDGNTTIQGAGSTGNDLLVGGAGNDSITAGKGDVTMSGGGGIDTIVAGAGNDVVALGTKGGLFVAGTGHATVAGGSALGAGTQGADIYSFTRGKAGGVDLIAGFRVGIDHIALQGYGSGAAAAAVSSALSVGGSSQITLADGTQIVLADVSRVTAAVFV